MSGGRIQRAPGAADRARGDRPPRDARSGQGDGRNQRGPAGQRDNRGPQHDSGRGDNRGPQRDGGRGDNRPRRDSGPRVYETPVPQDERSIELGALFRESQIAVREAKKVLAKRKTEFEDEPAWMLEQLQEAVQRFEAVATDWSEHLEKTGRKVVRR